MNNSRDAIAAYKTLINRGFRENLATALELEAETTFVISDTEERIKEFWK